MEKVKVISEKYNDEDVLQMNSADFKSAIEHAVGQELSKIGSIDTTKLIHKDFSVFSKVGKNELELSDVIDVLNKSFTDDYETVWYPLLTADYNGWFAFLGNDFQYILYELDDYDEPTAFSDISCHDIEIKSIVPNPTLAGTESRLEGLEVDNTKYKVESGTKLYKHEITFNNGASFSARTARGMPYTDIVKLFDEFNAGVIWGVFVSSSNFQGTLLSINGSGSNYSFFYYDSDLGSMTSEVCTSIESDRVLPL